jgi:hypothetical protein
MTHKITQIIKKRARTPPEYFIEGYTEQALPFLLMFKKPRTAYINTRVINNLLFQLFQALNLQRLKNKKFQELTQTQFEQISQLLNKINLAAASDYGFAVVFESQDKIGCFVKANNNAYFQLQNTIYRQQQYFPVNIGCEMNAFLSAKKHKFSINRQPKNVLAKLSFASGGVITIVGLCCLGLIKSSAIYPMAPWILSLIPLLTLAWPFILGVGAGLLVISAAYCFSQHTLFRSGAVIQHRPFNLPALKNP